MDCGSGAAYEKPVVQVSIQVFCLLSKFCNIQFMFMKKIWIFFAISVLMLMSGQLLAEERIKLDDTAIVGSRELPKVTYIVPWKNSNIAELGSVAGTSPLADNLQALDRDVFLKELDYYSMLDGTGRQTQP